MGITDKVRSKIVHNIFGFTTGATLTSTTGNLIIASSGLTATSTLTATAGAVFSSNIACSGITTYSSAASIVLPNYSTGTAPVRVGLIGRSTASSKMIISVSTTDWLIVSTA